MTNNNLSQRIAEALTISDFEEAARAIELSDCREEPLAMYRVRLADLDLDLPERLRAHAEHIMAAEPIYEELHKVFSLAESLARLDRIGIGGARARLDALSHRIRQQAQVDARYDTVRAAIHGAGAPTWWDAAS